MKRKIVLFLSRIFLMVSFLWMIFGFLISRELSWDFITLAIVVVVFVLPFVLCLLLHHYIKGKSMSGTTDTTALPKVNITTTSSDDAAPVVEIVPAVDDTIPVIDDVEETKSENVSSEPQDGSADTEQIPTRATALGFPLASDGHYRSYVYQFVDIAFPVINIINSLSLYNIVTFEHEPNNQYDPDAVCVMHDGVKIGYLYRGKLQKMVADFINRDDYMIAYIDSIDVDKFTIAIAFYKPIASIKHISTTLVKTTKKDDFGISRQDNLSYVSVDDVLNLSYSFDSETFVVSDDYGNDVGELSKSVSGKLYSSGDDYIAICEEITCDENEKIKCKVALISK